MSDFLTDHFFAAMFYMLAGLIFARFVVPAAFGLVAANVHRKPPIERRRAKLMKQIAKSEKAIEIARQMREYSGDAQLMLRAQRDTRHHTRMLTLYRAQLHEMTDAAPPTPAIVSKPREHKDVTHARSLGTRHMVDAWRTWATSETPGESAARRDKEERAAEARRAKDAAERESRVERYMKAQDADRATAEAKIDEIDKKNAYMTGEQYRRRTHGRSIGGFTSYDEYALYMNDGVEIDGRSTSSERRAAREKTEAKQLIENPPVSDWDIEKLRSWGAAALSGREMIVQFYDVGTWEKHLDYCCALVTDKRDESFDTKSGLTATKQLRHEDTAVRDAYIAGGIAGAERIADAISRSRMLVRTDQQTAHAIDDVSRRMNAALVALKETHKPTEERAEHDDWKTEFESIATPAITAGPEPEQGAD